MEYHAKFGHTILRIQHISLISRIEFFYTYFQLATQTVSPTLPGLKVINISIKYLSSHRTKHISYPSNYYDGLNVIRLTWSGNQVEYHKTDRLMLIVLA